MVHDGGCSSSHGIVYKAFAHHSLRTHARLRLSACCSWTSPHAVQEVGKVSGSIWWIRNLLVGGGVVACTQAHTDVRSCEKHYITFESQHCPLAPWQASYLGMHTVFTWGMQWPKTVARQLQSVHRTPEAPDKHTWGVTVKLKGADVDPTR